MKHPNIEPPGGLGHVQCSGQDCLPTLCVMFWTNYVLLFLANLGMVLRWVCHIHRSDKIQFQFLFTNDNHHRNGTPAINKTLNQARLLGRMIILIIYEPRNIEAILAYSSRVYYCPESGAEV